MWLPRITANVCFKIGVLERSVLCAQTLATDTRTGPATSSHVGMLSVVLRASEILLTRITSCVIGFKPATTKSKTKHYTKRARKLRPLTRYVGLTLITRLTQDN